VVDTSITDDFQDVWVKITIRRHLMRAIVACRF